MVILDEAKKRLISVLADLVFQLLAWIDRK